MSLAVERWPSASSPVQFLNTVFFIPSSAALAFISSTKASSLPETASPRATQASLAELIAAAFSSSFTVKTSPGSSQIWLPPMEHACSLAEISVSIVNLPSSIASNTKSRVIIFVMDAGGICLSASCSKITVPVERSIKIADFADMVRFGSTSAAFFILPSSSGVVSLSPSAVIAAVKTIRIAMAMEKIFFMRHTSLLLLKSYAPPHKKIPAVTRRPVSA